MGIAFVRSADGGFNNSTSSYTFTIDCTGGSLLLVPTCWTGTGMTVSSSLDGALTQEAHLVVGHNNPDCWLFSLKNPTAASHTITVTKGSGTAGSQALAAVYSGTDTTAPVEAVATLESFSGTTDWPMSITTLSANAWTTLFFDCQAAGGSVSAGSGSTHRQDETAVFGSQISWYDSGADIASPGSTTMHLTTSFNSQYVHGVMASLKPAGGGGTNWGPSLLSHSWNRIVQ